MMPPDFKIVEIKSTQKLGNACLKIINDLKCNGAIY